MNELGLSSSLECALCDGMTRGLPWLPDFHNYALAMVTVMLGPWRHTAVISLRGLRWSLVCELCHISRVNMSRASIGTWQLGLLYGLQRLPTEADKRRGRLAREYDVDLA